MNLCAGCGETFGSLTAFDAHRVGKHAYLYSAERPDGRRCLTPSEMRAKGFRKNSRARWSLSPHVPEPHQELDLAGLGTYAAKDNS